MHIIPQVTGILCDEKLFCLTNPITGINTADAFCTSKHFFFVFRFIIFVNEIQVKKSKFREPGGSKKKKNDAVAAGTGEVEKATLVERPRDYVVTLHFPEVGGWWVLDDISLMFFFVPG